MRDCLPTCLTPPTRSIPMAIYLSFVCSFDLELNKLEKAGVIHVLWIAY